MPKNKLMSVVDAAGYSMAPTDDIVAMSAEFQPEKALRNGHQAAARVAAQPPPEASQTALQAEAWAHWLRDVFGPRSGGRATA